MNRDDLNLRMKCWLLDLDPADSRMESRSLDGESEDHLFAASLAAAAVLAVFVIVAIIATVALAARLVVAWFAQS